MSKIAAVVRAATSDDTAVLAALCEEHAAFEQAPYSRENKASQLSEALTRAPPLLTAWIAFEETHPVGYATATVDYATWSAQRYVHLDCLFVRAGHRDGGIGNALMQAVSQWARDRDLREIQWQTPRWNRDAQRFYERQGAIASHKVRFRLALP